MTAASIAAIEQEIAKYPTERKASAVMAGLRIAQEQHGWLAPELISEVAALVGVPRVRAMEVATFYSMYHLQPVGRHVIFLCTNLSCMLRGSDTILEHLQSRLGIRLGETSEDGKFTLKQVECLAACGGAPMMQVDKDYYEHLTPERVDEILEGLG
ncbi:MAG TPA: NADH-quinone oxidoreductase subunit NuoE [Gammaproteobacteria bacterium]|nr:NADH-quinone oxidoreductase subunit NuoE [Gammaproteobacteria bacterium]